MYLLIDTSTPTCKITLLEENWRHNEDWLADRTLARDLLKFISQKLAQHDKNMSDISAIGVFEGPGSFTGLRIGITVANTIADALSIPIVGGRGENWQEGVIDSLLNKGDQKIVLPYYGRDANIKSPKK